MTELNDEEVEHLLLPTKKIEKLIRKFSGGLSLDAGCGNGAYFNSFNGEVVAIDVFMPLLREAKKVADNKKVSLVHGDIRCPPFKNGVFDFILCTDVIEHLNRIGAESALRGFERVGRGRIVVGTLNINLPNQILRKIVYGFMPNLSDNNSPIEHHSFWSVKNLKSEGFKVKGCLGWVTRKYLRFNFIGDFYDYIVWNFPSLAGTIVGIKDIRRAPAHQGS